MTTLAERLEPTRRALGRLLTKPPVGARAWAIRSAQVGPPAILLALLAWSFFWHDYDGGELALFTLAWCGAPCALGVAAWIWRRRRADPVPDQWSAEIAPAAIALLTTLFLCSLPLRLVNALGPGHAHLVDGKVVGATVLSDDIGSGGANASFLATVHDDATGGRYQVEIFGRVEIGERYRFERHVGWLGLGYVAGIWTWGGG